MDNFLKPEVDTSLSFRRARFIMDRPISTGENIRRFFFTIYDNDRIDSLSGKLTPQINNLYQYFYYLNIKEDFYITAIDNLIKKNDYLQLTIQFDQELITKEEFENELERNEKQYLIKMKQSFKEDDFKIINDIIPKLKRNFSGDEISELFSIPIEKVNSYIEKVNSYNNSLPIENTEL